jgi:hypothetical protein
MNTTTTEEKMKRALKAILMIHVLLLAACGGSTTSVVPTQPPVSTGEIPIAPTEENPVAPTDAAVVDHNALPVEPQEITFQASDGQDLTGRYYPAATSPGPLVVLMHWVNGNMTDWNEIAPWLQNRGLENPFLPNPGDEPWWDPTWFPEMTADRTYGVFIFNFRDCEPMSERGCVTWDTDGWLLDAQAAMLKAVELDGVDPAKIVAMGSSIGADGAINGCVHLNEQHPGSCQGALSLSPGGYLGMSYENAVKRLGENQPQVAAWCLADETEIGICNTAANTGNPFFQAWKIPGGGHGNMLLRPDLDPLPMQLILDFLLQTIDQ